VTSAGPELDKSRAGHRGGDGEIERDVGTDRAALDELGDVDGEAAELGGDRDRLTLSVVGEAVACPDRQRP
jgi:hypothetical protein